MRNNGRRRDGRRRRERRHGTGTETVGTGGNVTDTVGTGGKVTERAGTLGADRSDATADGTLTSASPTANTTA